MIEIHPTNKNEVAWTSWLPALGYALAASTGPVLEIGVGHFSTPFLHEYCKGANRGLWSCESDEVWRKHFDKKYGWDESHAADKAFHRFGYPFRGLSCETKGLNRFGVVFIDNSPGGQARLEPFIGFLDKSEFIVVHDYHRENEEAIKPFLEGVNYKIFNDYDPPTLLASKSHKL